MRIRPRVCWRIQQQNVLLTALDGRDRHGFATPCGQAMAGGQDYIEPLRVAGLVSYVRGVDGRPDDVRADASKLDTMYVPARFFPADVPAADLIRLARDTAAGGGLTVYLFTASAGITCRFPPRRTARRSSCRNARWWMVVILGSIWLSGLSRRNSADGSTAGQNRGWWEARHPSGDAPGTRSEYR